MRAILSLILVSLAALSACERDAGSADRAGEHVGAVASFYPLAFVAERVGGDRVTVTNLTPPGVEPHDLELTPDDLEAVGTADVVLTVGGGFQPSVEEAVQSEASGITIDALAGVPALPGLEGGGDPHVWLDPGARRVVERPPRRSLRRGGPCRRGRVRRSGRGAADRARVARSRSSATGSPRAGRGC